jgi:hypothetical protein
MYSKETISHLKPTNFSKEPSHIANKKESDGLIYSKCSVIANQSKNHYKIHRTAIKASIPVKKEVRD